MKRWTILFLVGLIILQSACSDTPRVPPETFTEKTEVNADVDMDPLKTYPAERPEITSPQTNKKEEASSSEEKTPSKEESVPVSEEQSEEEIPNKPTEPENKPVEAPVTHEQPKSEENTAPEKAENAAPQVQPRSDEVRAVWMSFFELEEMLMGQGESAYTKNIGKAFDNIAAMGLNTVILQVRPYADAIYPSEYFPWSYLATGTEGKALSFDPLAIAVREAHNRGLEIEAWINPYRIRNSNYDEPLSGNIKAMLNSGDAIDYNGAITFDPASEKAQKLIVDGVKEIVSNYNVDGIHFDDYFYPTTDEAFDKVSYNAYKQNGGRLALAEWRRENVNSLVKQVYSAVHSIKSSVRFGISPQGNLGNNYDKQFIDVAKWLSSGGYVDYICPQVYFGFKNKTSPYAETVSQWNELIKNSSVKLIIGLAPYKVGTVDSWAGEGKNEWMQNSDMLSRMINCARNEEKYNGFVLFRYNSLFSPSNSVKAQVKEEIENLKEVLE